MTAQYDSRAATLFHSQRVGELMVEMVKEALDRFTCHDRSKTESPAVECFDEYTSKLKGATYGSDEYKQWLAEMKPALDHHYAANRHHPEHFPNGVNDMTLVDLIEMIADWKAGNLPPRVKHRRDLCEPTPSLFCRLRTVLYDLPPWPATATAHCGQRLLPSVDKACGCGVQSAATWGITWSPGPSRPLQSAPCRSRLSRRRAPGSRAWAWPLAWRSVSL